MHRRMYTQYAHSCACACICWPCVCISRLGVFSICSSCCSNEPKNARCNSAKTQIGSHRLMRQTPHYETPWATHTSTPPFPISQRVARASVCAVGDIAIGTFPSAKKTSDAAETGGGGQQGRPPQRGTEKESLSFAPYSVVQ